MGIDMRLPHFSNITPPTTHPYDSQISSSASSSSSSVFSVDAAFSQSSQASQCPSSAVQIQWEADDIWGPRQQVAPVPQDSSCRSTVAGSHFARTATYPAAGRAFNFGAAASSLQSRVLPPIRTDVALPPEQRLNPRRCSQVGPPRAPPALVRQSERKVNFVDVLVDSATQMVEVIWPLSTVPCHQEAASGRGVLPLRTFIQETLRRSRTSYSTLQVALYYLILIKGHVPSLDFTMEQPTECPSLRALQCGRRMFLAALILASKYLQDKNYSARAWAKISGLKVCEINSNEMTFLKAVNWKLHIPQPLFQRWQDIVLKYSSSQHPPSPTVPGLPALSQWKAVIPQLTPELNTIDVAPATPSVERHFGNLSMRSPTLPEPAAAEVPRSASQESTPLAKLPRFLEPRTEMIPPTPHLPRMGPLPTPQLTPQSALSGTPAVSASGLDSRRSSMCLAMAQAQNMCMSRTAVDAWNPMSTSRFSGAEGYFSCRRSSLAQSVSSGSSPESMVSDTSRSSRASSISSVSSATLAQGPATLARHVTCRNARLPYPACKDTLRPNEPFMVDDIRPLKPNTMVCPEIVESPDFSAFSLDGSVTPVRNISPENVPRSVERVSPGKRKREHSASVDPALQQRVRHLLAQRTSSIDTNIVPDPVAAQSFLTRTPDELSPTSSKGLQSLSNAESRRLPIMQRDGRKRACCASELVVPPLSGPGMWEGIL